MSTTLTKLQNESQFQDQRALAVEIDSSYLRRVSTYKTPEGESVIASPKLDRDILNTLGCVADKKVLVYGCGFDNAAIWFAQQGAHVIAIDISAKSIEIQHTLADKLNLKINCLVADAHNTQFPAASYDIIYGNAILHHLDIESSVAEIRRLLKPDGFALFRDVLAGNALLRCFRKLTPFWRTADEHPLGRGDFATFGNAFSTVNICTYGFFVQPYLLLLRLINTCLRNITGRKKNLLRKNLTICSFCDKLDRILFYLFPFLKSQAWLCLIELKP